MLISTLHDVLTCYFECSEIRVYEPRACYTCSPRSEVVPKDWSIIEHEILAPVELENFFCGAKITIFAAEDRHHTTEANDFTC
jgi:hypothetical protein